MNTSAISRYSRYWAIFLKAARPPASRISVQGPRALRSETCRYASSANGNNITNVTSKNVNNNGIVRNADSLGGVEPIGGKNTENSSIDKAKLEKLANLGTRKSLLPHLLFFCTTIIRINLLTTHM